eukprot:906893-Prymnesium_polylepis.1
MDRPICGSQDHPLGLSGAQLTRGAVDSRGVCSRSRGSLSPPLTPPSEQASAQKVGRADARLLRDQIEDAPRGRVVELAVVEQYGDAEARARAEEGEGAAERVQPEDVRLGAAAAV